MADVTWNDDGEHELAFSDGLRRALDAAAFTITAHAVPYSGVDTGRLIASMGHTTRADGGSLVAVLGSGAQDGVAPVYYASYHWADRPDPGATKSDQREIRKHVPHPTKAAPTRPYSQAMRELGITFSIEPGGFES